MAFMLEKHSEFKGKYLEKDKILNLNENYLIENQEEGLKLFTKELERIQERQKR